MQERPRYELFFKAIERIIRVLPEPLHRLSHLSLDLDPDQRFTAEACLTLVANMRRTLVGPSKFD